MSRLQKKFSVKDWQDCCGKLCDDCKVAEAYKNHYGKKEGEKKLKKDKKEYYKII